MRLRIQARACWSCGSGRWFFVRDSLGGALSQPHRFSGKILSGCSMLLGPSAAATALALMQPESLALGSGLRMAIEKLVHPCMQTEVLVESFWPQPLLCTLLLAGNSAGAPAGGEPFVVQVPARSKWRTCQSLHADNADGQESSWRIHAGTMAATALAQAQTGTIEWCRGLRMANGTHIRACLQAEEENYNCSSQPRADQMLGHPWVGQLMCAPFLSILQ